MRYTYIDVPPLPPKTAADVIIIVISVLPSMGRGIFYRAKDAPAVRGTTRYNILYICRYLLLYIEVYYGISGIRYMYMNIVSTARVNG